MRLKPGLAKLLQITFTRKALDGAVRKNLYLAIYHVDVHFLALREHGFLRNAGGNPNCKAIAPTL